MRWNPKPMSMNQKHNRRDKSLTDKEHHIDPNGLCMILKDESVVEAYEKLFQNVLDDYNKINIRKNPDRCMDAEEYANKVIQKYVNNEKKRAREKATGKKEYGYSSVPWLEYTVYLATPDYDKDPDHKLNMTEKEQIELLKEWLKNFQKRNPNLYVFGAYIHADEWGTNGVKGQLHMHLCIIPFERCNRGLKLKVSEANAYKQMGINQDLKTYTDKDGNKREKVASLRESWKNKEVSILDEMLEERGYTPYHPGGRGEAWERKEMHQAHMQMAQQETRDIRNKQLVLESLSEQELELKKDNDKLKQEQELLQEQIDDLKQDKKSLSRQIISLQRDCSDLQSENAYLTNELDSTNAELNNAKEEASHLHDAICILHDKHKKLKDSYDRLVSDISDPRTVIHRLFHRFNISIDNLRKAQENNNEKDIEFYANVAQKDEHDIKDHISTEYGINLGDDEYDEYE